MDEIWKQIKGYEGLYEVSNCGNIYSKISHKCLKQMTDKYGYLYVNLYKENKLYHKTVHRLVAEAFIPNTDNLPQVNHKDENKINNIVSNLEWCNNYYNLNYGNRLNKAMEKRKLPILQFTKNMEFVSYYKSIKDAALINGFNGSNICWCLKGNIKSAYGFLWIYAC